MAQLPPVAAWRRRQELDRLCAALEAGKRDYPPPRMTVWDMIVALFALRRGRREIERVRRSRARSS